MRLKVAIHGVKGKMGKTLVELIEEEKDRFELVGAIEREGHPELGTKVSNIFEKVILTSNYKDGLKGCDVVIDFSTPQATQSLLSYLIKNPIKAVIGTTGLNDDTLNLIKELSEKSAVVYSPNMSFGMNILFWLVELLAPKLYKIFDIEILEIHHRQKKDAPSGSALKLGEIISLKTGLNITQNRWGEKREGLEKKLGISFIRGGDTIGEHTIFFLGEGEQLLLTHKATSRKVFAKGALFSAQFLSTKEKGYYTLREILGL